MSNIGDNFKLSPDDAARLATDSEILRIVRETPEASMEVAIFMFVIGGVAAILSSLIAIWLYQKDAPTYTIVHSCVTVIVGLVFVAYGIWCVILKSRLDKRRVFISPGVVIKINSISMSSDNRVMCLVNGSKTIDIRIDKNWCKDMNINVYNKCMVGWIHGAKPTLV